MGEKYPELPRKRLTPGWWLSNRHYTLYMLRELTSFFVALFSLLYIWQVAQLASDTAGYNSYLSLVRNPGMVLFGIIALGFTLYHSVTWFYLTGQVQPLKIGKTKTTPWQALVVNLVLLIIISYAVIRILIGG